MKVNAILLKPLDGLPVGAPQSFEKADFDRLEAMNAVREADADDAVVDDRADADAQLLERLRHPVDGPRMLADLKAAMEAHERERQSLQDRLSIAEAAVTQLTSERDEAKTDYAAAQVDLKAALSERDAARSELAAGKITEDASAGTTSTLAGKPAAKPKG